MIADPSIRGVDADAGIGAGLISGTAAVASAGTHLLIVIGIVTAPRGHPPPNLTNSKFYPESP